MNNKTNTNSILEEEMDIQDTTQESAELSLEDQYAQVLAELEELKKENLRILADSENFKKRMQREKDEYCKFATSTILEEIIPVIDNLDLALAHSKDNAACQDLALGVEMTQKIFLDTMKKHGLEQIAELDVPFDPTRHEAMGQIQRADLAENIVCQILQKGYALKERLLRPAKVMVSCKSGD